MTLVVQCSEREEGEKRSGSFFESSPTFGVGADKVLALHTSTQTPVPSERRQVKLSMSGLDEPRSCEGREMETKETRI